MKLGWQGRRFGQKAQQVNHRVTAVALFGDVCGGCYCKKSGWQDLQGRGRLCQSRQSLFPPTPRHGGCWTAHSPEPPHVPPRYWVPDGGVHLTLTPAGRVTCLCWQLQRYYSVTQASSECCLILRCLVHGMVCDAQPLPLLGKTCSMCEFLFSQS